MKKVYFCVSLALAGLMASCVDKNEEVDADARPAWLGESIYAELKNPEAHGLLTGTFTNYLRLIDDLGYDEVLARTGSKTVFPANDEAFGRFFQDNAWGVRSYEQLSEAQKKLLLYSSMLDNALLLGMLPNVSNGTNEPLKNAALKHLTNVSVTDSVQFITGSGSTTQRPAGMPANNSYWEKYYEKGIHVVSDATVPMMVHLTREYMLNNGITTLDDQSDFAILTGTPYTVGTAYVFNDRVVNGDVTCQNGYIHQMENVIVPPGNMAQVLREKDNTQYFSRILDYYAVPEYDARTTNNYNDWALQNGKPQIDSIFQVRYFSSRSQDQQSMNTDPITNRTVSTNILLRFDPGWNQYYPSEANAGNTDISIKDMGAIFVPSDKAVKDYFLEGGLGAYLIDIYGNYKGAENTEEHLAENLDSLRAKNPSVLTEHVKNLMRASFAGSVPSKFETLTNDASELLGISTSMLHQTADGKYDITIANNGALYVIDEMLVPDRYRSVMGPSAVYPDLKVMGWAVDDRTYLGVDFQFYLKAMRANYAFFVPEDAAFDYYYLDPTSLGHVSNGKQAPEVLHFWYDTEAEADPRQAGPYLKCDRYLYNMETGQIDTANVRSASISEVQTQLIDILNYHTVVLGEGEVIGANHYYQTKHGGEIYVDGNSVGSHVMSGGQIENPTLFPASGIKEVYSEKNGNTYRLDHVIQPPTKSVFSVLKNTVIGKDTVFADFLAMCDQFSGAASGGILDWAGIPKENPKSSSMPSPQDAYIIFSNIYKLGKTETADACLDYNVRMFNTYNYTLFAPDNDAMQQARDHGLPTWQDVEELFEYHATVDTTAMQPTELAMYKEQLAEDKALAYLMINAMRDFVRFHFVTNSVYADNTISGGRYQTLSSDETGVAKEVNLRGGGGTISVTDLNGHTVTVNAGDQHRVVNQMTRDYWFNTTKQRASAIETSSFCAVHQISEPLYSVANGRFDNAWASRTAFAKAMRDYQQKKANNEL